VPFLRGKEGGGKGKKINPRQKNEGEKKRAVWLYYPLGGRKCEKKKRGERMSARRSYFSFPPEVKKGGGGGRKDLSDLKRGGKKKRGESYPIVLLSYNEGGEGEKGKEKFLMQLT